MIANTRNRLHWPWVCVAVMVSAAHAADVQAPVGASIVSPSDAATTAATQVLFSTSTGVFSLSIPGAATPAGLPVVRASELFMCLGRVQTDREDLLTCLWPSSPLALKPSVGTPSVDDLFAVMVTDGTLNSTEGVSLSINTVDGASRVVAIVAYN
jgi:hypothetical protein